MCQETTNPFYAVWAVLLLLSVAFCNPGSAAPEPFQRLMPFGITNKILTDLALDKFPDNLAYTIRNEITSSAIKDDEPRQETEITVAAFDPRRPEGSRWKLLEWNGTPPDEKQKKTFDERHNAENDDDLPDDIISLEQPEILDDTDQYLAVRLNLDASKLKGDIEILKHCRMTVVVDKSTRLLDRIELENFEPFRQMMVARILEFKIVIRCMPNPFGDGYLISQTRVYNKTRALGQEIEVSGTTVYSNYEVITSDISVECGS